MEGMGFEFQKEVSQGWEFYKDGDGRIVPFLLSDFMWSPPSFCYFLGSEECLLGIVFEYDHPSMI